MLFEFCGMLSVVSLWREPEKRSGVWDSSGLCDSVLSAYWIRYQQLSVARELSAVTQTPKYLTPNSAGAPVDSIETAGASFFTVNNPFICPRPT